MDTAWEARNVQPNTNSTADSKGVAQQLHYEVQQNQVEASSEDPEAKPRQHKVQDTYLGVAKGSASLGRAAEPPPSEKSSTLDAKNSKRPQLDEEDCGSDVPESASPSSALLVTGAISRRRSPRLAPVSILGPASQSQSPPTATSGHSNPPSPSHEHIPPVPPRPFASTSLTSTRLSVPVQDSAPPPVPPKTYLKTTPQATTASDCEAPPLLQTTTSDREAPPLPQTTTSDREAPPLPQTTTSDHEAPPLPQTTTSDREAPPLPQRLYLLENEDQGLQMSIEELGSAGMLHNPAEAPAPQEEDGGDDTVRSAKPLTTVLLPRGLRHSNTGPCNLHITCVEKCSKCLKMKKFIANLLLLEKSFLCDCCKKKTKVSRRSSH